MARKIRYNPGNINIEAVTESIVAEGGGISEKENWDGYRYAEGITHVSVYSRKENRHLSYNIDEDGYVTNVHTDMDNRALYNYGGGR